MREKRDRLPDNIVEQLSTAIQDRMLKSGLWPKKGGIGLYAPIRNEVQTHKLFQRALESGLHVYFPRVEQGIYFYEVDGPEDLQKGCWGILEPKAHCQPVLPENRLDLLVIPGLAFSSACRRIGTGRGCYNKFLNGDEENGPVVGLAYDFQIIEMTLADQWDQTIHGVMTEKNFYSRDL